MKKIIFFFASILLISTINAQSWVWAKSAGGSSDDISNCSATDASGNVYIIGSFKSTSISFGSTTLSNSGNADIFIAKFNSSGTVLWATKAGGTLDDVGNSIAVDNNGNVFVTGYFKSSSITLGSHTLNFSGLNGGSTIFIAKFDASGNSVWAKSPTGPTSNGTADANSGNFITTDNNGNVYVTGSFETTTITFGSITLNHKGWFDMYIVKYNNNGTEIWANSASGQCSDAGKSIAVDNSGNVYVTGYFGGQCGGGTTTFGSVSLSDVWWEDAFIVKYDVDGTVLWAKSAGGNDKDYGNGICVDISGNAYIIGQFKSPSIAFGSTTLTNTNTSTSTVNNDIFVAKYNNSGSLLWAKKANGSSNDYGNSIIIYGGNTLLLSGYFTSSSLWFETSQVTNSGVADIFLAHYDLSGNVLSAQGIGNTSTDVCNSLCHDGNGNFYFTGNFYSSSISFGNNTINNSGSSDLFLAKYYICPSINGSTTISGDASVCVGQTVSYTATAIPNATSYVWTLPNGATGNSSTNIINVTFGSSSVSGNLTVKGVNSCSESSPNSKLITVNPLPSAAGTISGLATVCQGQNSATYTLPTIANATSVIWSLPSGATGTSATNSITVNYGASAASGNITAKGTNTCGNGATSTFPIIVNNKPATPTISQVGNILHSDAISGNQWYNQSGSISGAINQDYTVTVNGNYYTIVTLSGCSSSASNAINVNTDGIEIFVGNGITKIYPNPISSELIIEMEGNYKRINFDILNTIGLVVFKGSLVEKTTIQTCNFASGIYTIRLENGKTFEFKKIMKE